MLPNLGSNLIDVSGNFRLIIILHGSIKATAGALARIFKSVRERARLKSDPIEIISSTISDHSFKDRQWHKRKKNRHQIQPLSLLRHSLVATERLRENGIFRVVGFLSQRHGSVLRIFDAAGKVIETRRREPVMPIKNVAGGLEGPSSS